MLGGARRLTFPFRLIERKVSHCGARSQSFDLEGYLVDDEVVAGKWTARGTLGAKENYGLLPGSTSWGVWPKDAPWGSYRLHEPDGTLKGYRFDALCDLSVAYCSSDNTTVELTFRDLLLDARVSVAKSSKVIRLEDEDEAKAAFDSGRISRQDGRLSSPLETLHLAQVAAAVLRP